MIDINSKLYSKMAILLLGIASITWNANPAKAISGTSSLDNEDFTIDTVGINNAPGNSIIDDTNTPTGFGFQFDNAGTFLLLGATDTGSLINGSPTNSGQNNVNVTATSAPFEITASNISDGFLNFNFDWSFQGTNDVFDSFFIGIAPTGTGSSNIIFPLLVNQSSYGFGTVDTDYDISGLSAGDYDLIVSLTESTGAGNSAAAFDNISISEVPPDPTPVPFEASPTLGLLIVGGLFGGSSYLKRRQSAAKIDLK